MSNQSSWILKISNFFNLYDLKKIIIKRAYVFGSKVSNQLINFGYLIKSSQFFHKTKTPIHSNRIQHYDYLSNKYDLDKKCILYLEFGVYKGESFQYWLNINNNVNSKFIGFDTFTGLPEEWGHIKIGYFDTKGNVPVFEDNRYEFKKGLFQDTLPFFIEQNIDLFESKSLLINFDADLYSSTLYTLVKIAPYLKKGDLLTFDEFFSVVNSSTEFRAFIDFLSISNIKYKVVSKTNTHCAVIIE